MKKLRQAVIRHFDKALLFLLLCVLAVGIISQLGLLWEPTRSVFTQIDTYEGVEVGRLSQLKTASITLELVEGTPGSAIKVLLDGEIIGDFSQRNLTCLITKGGLIEIDASKVKGTIMVKVTKVSEHLTPNLKGKTMVLTHTIGILSRVAFQ